MIGKMQPPVRFEAGWLSVDTSQGVLKVRLWPSPQAQLSPEGLSQQNAETHASRLLKSLQLPLPESWGMDHLGFERVLDPAQFYAETFSVSCRSNDAIRRALLAMPSGIEEPFLRAPPNQRWSMLKQLAADYEAEEALVAEPEEPFADMDPQDEDMA